MCTHGRADMLISTLCCGRAPKLSDAELVTLAVALLNVRSDGRRLRFVHRVLPGMFPYPPKQSCYNRRLRAALPLVTRLNRDLARDTDFLTDAVWITSSTHGKRLLPPDGAALQRRRIGP
jgi:hypothetical protein